MKRALRVFLWLVGIGLFAVAGMAGYMMYRMGPRDFFGMLRYDQREEGELKVGDAAPDVELRALDGGSVRLRDRIGGRPLVLIFGSYT